MKTMTVKIMHLLTLWDGKQSRAIPTASSKMRNYVLYGLDGPLTSPLIKVWLRYFQESFPDSVGFYYQTFSVRIDRVRNGYQVQAVNLKTAQVDTFRISQNGALEILRLTKTQSINNDLMELMMELNQALNGSGTVNTNN